MDFLAKLFDQPWSPLFFGLAASFLLGVLITHSFLGWLRRRLGRRNRDRGLRAEKRAVKVLRKQGFRVVSSRPTYPSELLVNKRPKTYQVTPDLLVERDDQLYVVEVKRYRDNGGVSNAATRRQVLEYLHATGYPCLLVRMPEGLIDLVEIAQVVRNTNQRR